MFKNLMQIYEKKLEQTNVLGRLTYHADLLILSLPFGISFFGSLDYPSAYPFSFGDTPFLFLDVFCGCQLLREKDGALETQSYALA